MTAAMFDDATELTWIDLSSSPALRLQPPLRVLAGGGAQRTAAPYGRRRLVAAVVATAIAAMLLLTLTRLTTGSASPTSADVPSAAGVAAPATYVVRTGDTLWSIADAVAPDVDVRITVDRLVQLNGPAPIVVGQQLELP